MSNLQVRSPIQDHYPGERNPDKLKQQLIKVFKFRRVEIIRLPSCL